MKKLLASLLFLTTCLVMYAAPEAGALSCAMPGPISLEIEASSVVFKGKAIEAKGDGLTVFQVDQAWKGVDGPVVEIYDTGWDPYGIGFEYLVFGSENNGKLRTNLCGNTGQWNAGREQAMKETKLAPAVFNKDGLQEADQATNKSAADKPATDQLAWIAGIMVFAIVLILAIVWLGKKRRAG